MATLVPDSPPPSPTAKRRPRKWARRCERHCCTALTYFPLVFVYGLTTWAAWVEAKIGFLPSRAGWSGTLASSLGLVLYLLLNWCYSTAVFVDPGSPADPKAGYSFLPTHEPRQTSSLTVKSTGGSRFCKKCQTRKPDRAHHCSTCKRCVLKMDHHCPWLATCVGLRNYKAFILFLIYTTLFCWTCFAASASWVWNEILVDGAYSDDLMPVNIVLLAVISGIIGLVLAGFTGWHLSLACTNATTIERLEKTRYLSPLRKSMEHRPYPGGDERTYGQQFVDIHANSLPGVTRAEEGEERRSPSQPSTGPSAAESLRMNYTTLEQARERQRYSDYLDELDSEKLPNAFDLGWRRNLRHLFGDSPWLWCVPVCNTTGDGWTWEASPGWVEAREGVRRQREGDWARYEGGEGEEPVEVPERARHYVGGSDGTGMSLQTLRGDAKRADDEGDEDYDSSSDEDATASSSTRPLTSKSKRQTESKRDKWASRGQDDW
ncbi:MAG: palmitoyltransferase for Vac8p [Thelocarpon impressellum]|nr:MAG: palmitoyltransferase for Vac8p [Thelocarpon impressellum]